MQSRAYTESPVDFEHVIKCEEHLVGEARWARSLTLALELSPIRSCFLILPGSFFIIELLCLEEGPIASII